MALLLASSSSSYSTMDSKGNINSLNSLEDSRSETLKSPTPYFKIRKMYFAALSALFFALNTGLILGYSAPATYDMSQRRSSRIKPTENEISWIGAIVGLGIAVGGLLAGPLADKIGRKDTLVLSIIPIGLGWILICLAETVIMVIIGRFFCGISCGIIMVVVPMYCVEISTPEVRGILGSGFQGFLVTGNLLSVAIGSFISWDYLALNGAIFSIFGVICFCFALESPRWLVSKGRLKEAVLVINKLQGDFVDAEEECDEINKDIESRPKGKMSLKEYGHPTIYKPAFIALMLFNFQQLSGSSVVFAFSSEIFEISKKFIDPKNATIVLGTIQVVATLISNFIVDKSGRRGLLMLSGAIMAVTITVLGVFYYKSSYDAEFQSTYIWIPLLSLVLFVIGFSTGYGPIPYLLCAELLPTRARSTVGGGVSFLNAIVAFVVIKTFSDLRYHLQSYGTFWLYALLSIVGILFVLFIVPETKGKKLEEIESIFDNKKRNQRSVDTAGIVP